MWAAVLWSVFLLPCLLSAQHCLADPSQQDCPGAAETEVEVAEMRGILDLERYPLHRPQSSAYTRLLADCRASLASLGSVDLEGFILPSVLQRMAAEVSSLASVASVAH